MRLFRERNLHEFFEIGVVLKAIDSSVELITGSLLLLLSPAAVQSAITAITGDELTEVPRDFLWKIVVQTFQGFAAYPQTFWAILLLAHGIVKMFLVIGLLKNKIWAFPAAAAVFTLFAATELVQIAIRPSIFLGLVAAFDIALIALILHEYKHRKKRISTDAA